MPNRERGDQLLLAVARLNRWASRHAHLPIPAAQLRLLSLMGELGPSRIGDLAKADNSSQPTMTTQVQRLESLGYVTRRVDDRDARATLVTLSPPGRKVLEQARSQRGAAVMPLLSEMTGEQLAAIDTAVEAITAALDENRLPKNL